MDTVARALLTDLRDTLFPGRSGKYGLLPPLLVGLTVITGLVDAFSYLSLGHVFVANMTGNVVFLAFGLVGVGGFSVATSLVAIGAFILGALGGGFFRSRLSSRLRRQLAAATGSQLLLLVAGVILSAIAGGVLQGGLRYGLVAVLAVAMGIQNATARGLAVPDLTTTVLTMTITGIAADTHAAGGTGSRAGRRLISIAAMLGGALVGAVLIMRGQVTAALVIALILLAVVNRRDAPGPCRDQELRVRRDDHGWERLSTVDRTAGQRARATRTCDKAMAAGVTSSGRCHPRLRRG